MRARAAAHAFRQHDNPAAVEIGNVRRTTWVLRIGRIALECRAVGNADEIGAERPGFRLNLVPRERLLERRNHYSSVPVSARAASLRACCAFLNSCNCRATIPL